MRPEVAEPPSPLVMNVGVPAPQSSGLISLLLRSFYGILFWLLFFGLTSCLYEVGVIVVCWRLRPSEWAELSLQVFNAVRPF